MTSISKSMSTPMSNVDQDLHPTRFPVRSSSAVALAAPASSLLATARHRCMCCLCRDHTVSVIPGIGTFSTDPYSGRPESGIRFEIEGVAGQDFRLCGSTEPDLSAPGFVGWRSVPSGPSSDRGACIAASKRTCGLKYTQTRAHTHTHITHTLLLCTAG